MPTQAELLTKMARQFYAQAEAASPEDFQLLFELLVEHDVRSIAKLLRDYGLNPDDPE